MTDQKPNSETLTIAITNEFADENKHFCNFIYRLRQAASDHVSVSLILIAQGEQLKIMTQLTKFTELGINFNRVIMCSDQQVPSVMAKFAKVMTPDIIMTSKVNFAKQCQQMGLPTTILSAPIKAAMLQDTLNFAFDGDSVLFCHQAQHVADNNGVDAFDKHEQLHQNTIMGKGPLFEFIRKIDLLQTYTSKISWSLVTARGGKALNRAMNTIAEWQLNPRQCFFMEGGDKTPALNSLNSDIFFDDHPTHCERASKDMLVGHVQCD